MGHRSGSGDESTSHFNIAESTSDISNAATQRYHQSCTQWAEADACELNPGFMLSECESVCSQNGHDIRHLACIHWAEAGECEHNQEFMVTRCGKECKAIEKRLACSRFACTGQQTRCAVSQEVDHSTSVITAHQWRTNVSFRNDAVFAVQLFWVNDETAQEIPYSVLVPGNRINQETSVGYRWRARQLLSLGKPTGQLLLDVRVGTLYVENCACEVHSRRPYAYLPIPMMDNEAASATKLVVISALAWASTVNLWNGTSEAQKGSIYAPGSLEPNRSSYLLLHGLHAGHLLTVRRVRDSALLLQHMVGDYVIKACAEDVSDPEKSRAIAANEKLKLQRRRSRLIHENIKLRTQLARLDEIDLSAVEHLPEDVLLEYTQNATAALEMLEGALRKPIENLKMAVPQPSVQRSTKMAVPALVLEKAEL
eukprot:CAMPEP_0119349728 /NCGR_PEP_ID=MMETSP1333-20130426/109698_1 /TAXON_ID=418940 /ORGANISM="Scyphosphaera apsteinii, Strain RCC1455" /LENGTH=425 /DNA_ID=CAMNT_0007362331 /DNA_START=28 /DNA_END=1306 /DNA_ORIENTATION=-